MLILLTLKLEKDHSTIKNSHLILKNVLFFKFLLYIHPGENNKKLIILGKLCELSLNFVPYYSQTKRPSHSYISLTLAVEWGALALLFIWNDSGK